MSSPNENRQRSNQKHDQTADRDHVRTPINLASPAFHANQEAYYTWLREEAPACKGKIRVINVYLLSRYDDCVHMLQDSRFVHNRTSATGGSRLPFPMPKSVSLMAQSMILKEGLT